MPDYRDGDPGSRDFELNGGPNRSLVPSRDRTRNQHSTKMDRFTLPDINGSSPQQFSQFKNLPTEYHPINIRPLNEREEYRQLANQISRPIPVYRHARSNDPTPNRSIAYGLKTIPVKSDIKVAKYEGDSFQMVGSPIKEQLQREHDELHRLKEKRLKEQRLKRELVM